MNLENYADEILDELIGEQMEVFVEAEGECLWVRLTLRNYPLTEVTVRPTELELDGERVKHAVHAGEDVAPLNEGDTIFNEEAYLSSYEVVEAENGPDGMVVSVESQ